MEKLNFEFSSALYNAEDTFQAVAGCCGSLAASRERVTALVEALRAEDALAVSAAASALVEDAVPEEGNIHPRRAKYEVSCDGVVYPRAFFFTPGGVTVAFILSPHREGELKVDFGRDSINLAAQMCAARLPRALPGEAAIIAQAIAAWAEEVTR